MAVAITGATGFIGKALLRRLSSQCQVVALTRKEPLERLAGVEYRICGNLSPAQEWSNFLSGVDVVVHAAALVHVMRERSSSYREYRDINVQGTLNLARQTATLGAKRFVFLSSVKVNGEFTSFGNPFRAADSPKPEDAYGASKMEAEFGLHEISRETGMEVVCIRPPLVYGPGVKGNFLTLLRWLERGLPLPLGAVHNRRSLVALDNLVDLIAICLNHPNAANETFLVSDDEDLSTTDLLRRMGSALDRPTRLIPVPPRLLRWGAKLFGKEDIAQRLLGNLQVDISVTREHLCWKPPVSVEEALRRTAEWYLTQ